MNTTTDDATEAPRYRLFPPNRDTGDPGGFRLWKPAAPEWGYVDIAPGVMDGPEDEYDPPLDPGVAPYVSILRANGVETYESCQGGEGHSYAEPAVRFHGEPPEGFRALAVAMQHGLPVAELRRVWRVERGEPVGPSWELTFWKLADPPRS